MSLILLPLLLLACTSDSDSLVRHGPDGIGSQDSGAGDTAEEADADADADTDSDTDSDADGDTDVEPQPDPCGFGWDRVFGARGPVGALPRSPLKGVGAHRPSGVAAVAHAEPAPPSFRRVRPPSGADDLVMPDYSDDMPLYERAVEWTTETRCYETPLGGQDLTEEEAWSLFVDLAETTTGVAVDTSSGHRTVVGLRGAWPGTFSWHGNAPDQFNDTLVLLWQEGGQGHVREFPVNTDTGNHDFGSDSSSSLRPNRRYHYVDGWHREYNALQMYEWGYHVQDDHNTNGHWDSDRNGWLPPYDGEDHDREGSSHNIHMASVDGPLGDARVDSWSAGCQTIPGMANWEAFVTQAWEDDGDGADYYLLDVRDLAPEVWDPCTPDGTHGCPYQMESFPYQDSRDTATDGSSAFDVYNCSSADESGREVVYVLRVDDRVTLSAAVEEDPGVDVDVHVLEGDDAQACLDRGNAEVSVVVDPGQYFVVVDTWTEGGAPMAGGYTLQVDVD